MIAAGNIIEDDRAVTTRIYPDSAAFVGHSWRALWRMVHTMPRLWISLVVLSALIWRIDVYFGGSDYRMLLNPSLSVAAVVRSAGIRLISGILYAAALMIALRAWLLGDRADRPVWRTPSGFGAFAAWYVGQIAFLEGIKVFAVSIGLRGEALFGIVVTTAIIGSLGFAWVFQLLPQLAVAVDDAGFRQAVRDGRGRYWRYLGLMMIATAQSSIVQFPMILLVAIGSYTLHTKNGVYYSALYLAWDMGARWVPATIGLVPIVILTARVQARLFAEARATV